MPSEEELIAAFKNHFVTRFSAAVARLTGDPMDELFMSPTKALVLARNWIQNEMDSPELMADLIAAAPDNLLIEWRTKHKTYLRMVMDEIEKRNDERSL